jgi:Plasma-membrane choline transporter
MCSICMLYVGFAALGVIQSPLINQGNPQRLLNGVDYMGNICGSSGVTSHLKQKWTPNSSGSNPDSLNIFVPNGFGICVASCPKIGDIRSDYYKIYGEWKALVDTVSVLNYCTTLDDEGYFVGDLTLSIFADIIRSASVTFVFGFPVPAILSMLFLSVVRLPFILRALVWVFVVLIFGFLAVCALVFLERASFGVSILSRATGSLIGETATSNKIETQLLKAAGGASAVAAIIWLCVVCFMRDRIALAIGLVRESSRALIAMPLLCFFPLLQVIVCATFTAIWAIFFFYLASSGTVIVQTSTDASSIDYKSVSYDDNAKHAIIFMVFGWFWNVVFLEAFGQLVASHAVLTWYFENSGEKIGSAQVIRSALIVSRYHLGTAAFGSLAIAVFRPLRICLEYVKFKLRPQSSSLVKCALCVLCCCLCCFDRCGKFVNKHAYVQCALFGRGFCVSAKDAFQLIVCNLGAVATMTVVGDFVVLIGKIGISLSCAAAAYLYMSKYMDSQLTGIVLPMLLVLFISFFTSTIFLGVISATADTVLQAFITDDQYNMGKLNSSGGNSLCMHLVIKEHRQLNDMADGGDINSTEEARSTTETGTSARECPASSVPCSQSERAQRHLAAWQQQHRVSLKDVQLVPFSKTDMSLTIPSAAVTVCSEKRKCQLENMFYL